MWNAAYIYLYFIGIQYLFFHLRKAVLIFSHVMFFLVYVGLVKMFIEMLLLRSGIIDILVCEIYTNRIIEMAAN